MQFTELIGDSIYVRSPLIHSTNIKEVKLVGVEAGGLWIESQELTNLVLDSYADPTIVGSRKTPLFFLPYHQISMVLTTIDGLVLREKAFGV
jgi:hypothetical protein